MHLPRHIPSPHTRSVELTITFHHFDWNPQPMDRFQCLAELVLDGQWTLEAIEGAISRFTAVRTKARRRLGAEIYACFKSRPTRNTLTAFLKKQEHNLCRKLRWDQVETARRFELEPTKMRGKVETAFARSIPSFPTIGSMAEWLGQPVGLVDWLSQHRKDHYRVNTTPKRSGGMRILESPRARLKAIQRSIAVGLLRSIPCHSSVHGFVHGRSAISFVQPHVKKQVVLRMDLQDFFPCIEASRIFGLFRFLGYPHSVAQSLTNLCTASCSQEKIEAVTHEHFRFFSKSEALERLQLLYCRKHLPQGAPTSPSLANLIAYRLDCRLSGLAGNAGINYTRYADDLLFSGSKEFGRFAKSFAIRVGSIALDEGFQVQFRKTRFMKAATQQSAAGIVINQCTNVRRLDYDQLKAVLYNSVRFGPSTQNRNSLPDFQSHLRGKISWVCQLHPARGEKLMRLFQAIDWSS